LRGFTATVVLGSSVTLPKRDRGINRIVLILIQPDTAPFSGLAVDDVNDYIFGASKENT
jgi:hypothetical protein